jgi:hypothetical protein
MDRAGERIKFGEFVRYGAPTAAITLVISSAFLTTHVFLGPANAFRLWWGVVALIVGVKLVRAFTLRGPARSSVER